MWIYKGAKGATSSIIDVFFSHFVHDYVVCSFQSYKYSSPAIISLVCCHVALEIDAPQRHDSGEPRTMLRDTIRTN